MRKIILYGELAKRFGKEHHFAVRSVSEAVQAMCVNFSGFRELFRDAHKYGIGFKVFVGRSSLKQESDATLPSGDTETIRIAPALFGSGGVVKIIVGAVLIVGGILVTGLSGGTAASIGSAMIKVGIGLTLTGVYQLLSPTPNVPGFDAGNNSESFMFSGPENVTQQGGAVPVGYGRMMVGSTVISAGIEDSDQ
jgi:predicted phage tail protein